MYFHHVGVYPRVGPTSLRTFTLELLSYKYNYLLQLYHYNNYYRYYNNYCYNRHYNH